MMRFTGQMYTVSFPYMLTTGWAKKTVHEHSFLALLILNKL